MAPVSPLVRGTGQTDALFKKIEVISRTAARKRMQGTCHSLGLDRDSAEDDSAGGGVAEGLAD